MRENGWLDCRRDRKIMGRGFVKGECSSGYES